ncbi:MAG: DinB family protein [Flavobacteriales bacterium]|nr:DinB family protein [Flavobacteriales bacterium]
MHNKHLEELIYRIDLVKQDVHDELNNLTRFQLNWKPDESTWSIGQCLEHIMIADRSYFSQIEKILSGKYRRPFWSLIPGKARFWGRLVIGLVKPESLKKVEAPQIFIPSASALNEELLDEFNEHEVSVLEYLKKLDSVNNDKYYVRSPFSPYITYKLKDVLEIMALHQERHFKQAKRILSHEKFPKADKLRRSDEEE